MPSKDHPPKDYPERLAFRSYLYVAPADRKAVAAAYDSAADSVVLDLEDLTPAAEKDAARLAVAARLDQPQGRPTLVRINASGTEAEIAADLDAAVRPGLIALRLPKSEDPDRIRQIARLTDDLRARRGIAQTIGLQVMVETARGIENLPALARATHTVWSLGIGEGDLRAELGTSADLGLLLARSSVVIAARAAHLPAPVQVAFPGGGTVADLTANTRLGRDLGFGGRSLINPDHVAVVHDIYNARAPHRGAAA